MRAAYRRLRSEGHRSACGEGAVLLAAPSMVSLGFGYGVGSASDQPKISVFPNVAGHSCWTAGGSAS